VAELADPPACLRKQAGTARMVRNMYYVYILKSEKDSKLYTGYTKNLKRRISEHNRGKTNSLKLRRPLKLIYYEVKGSLSEAIKREKYFKSGWGRKYIKEKLLSK
jgi:putative endonuclease